MKWQKCSAVFPNDHIIIQALTCTWERWQYCRLIAHDTGPRNQGRSDSTWNDAKLLQMRGCGYQLVFSVCTRSASENNTFSNMPGCIASASQTTICPLLRGQSHTVPLHCIMGKLPQGGGGLAASATWWWCKHERARGQRHNYAGWSAFVIAE